MQLILKVRKSMIKENVDDNVIIIISNPCSKDDITKYGNEDFCGCKYFYFFDFEFDREKFKFARMPFEAIATVEQLRTT